jgi:hypothetical protein
MKDAITNWKPVTLALRQRAKAILDQDDADEETSREDRDNAELFNVLARLVEGRAWHKAFGAPGDWGYQTPIGKALSETYKKPVSDDKYLTAAIASEINQAVQTLITGWEENDAEASQEAQRDQNQESWFRYMTAQIEVVVGSCVEKCVNLAAKWEPCPSCIGIGLDPKEVNCEACECTGRRGGGNL